MTSVCTICARGGSKGVPGKNIRLLGGKPLLHYSIKHAQATGMFDRIVVSSDSPDILSCALLCAPVFTVLRPADLASDSAPKIPAIRHAVAAAERELGIMCELVVDLDVTSPLRTPDDILAAVSLCRQIEVENVITGCPARRSPYFNLVEQEKAPYVRISKRVEPPIVRRQDAPRCFDMNASIYVWKRRTLFEQGSVIGPRTALFEMPEERSFDIDSELDFEIVNYLLGRNKISCTKAI